MKPAFQDGWRCDIESPSDFRALLDPPVHLVAGDEPTLYDVNKVVDWTHTENQSSVNSCQGHSITTSCEWQYRMATGINAQLNRMFAYVESQKLDGMRGDSGSTIGAGVKVAKEGLPLEEIWPYTGKYTRDIPKVCYDKRDYKLIDAPHLAKAQDAWNWLATDSGVIHIGMEWRSSMSGPGILVDDYGRGGGGGHAVTLGPLLTLRDDDGVPRVPLFNSHGTRWGHYGIKFLRWRVVEQIFASSGYGAAGIGKVVGPLNIQGPPIA